MTLMQSGASPVEFDNGDRNPWTSPLESGVYGMPKKTPSGWLHFEEEEVLDSALLDPIEEADGPMAFLVSASRLLSRSGDTSTSTESLRQRLDNANDYFRRKASEVFNDVAALRLLADLYEQVVVDVANFDPCENGIALAKLTAANFCEVGGSLIYITESGQRFVDSIEGAWASLEKKTRS